jgi:outer membrane protein assembly factor BamA
VSANPRKLGLALAALPIFISTPATIVKAAATKLVAIQAVGSKRFAPAEIVRATGLKPGSQVSVKTLQDVVNRLAATAAFAAVRYQYQSTPAGFVVTFRVRDAANFYPCRFDNFVWFSDKELIAELRTRVPLFKGEVPLTGSLPDQLDAALESLLKERGIVGRVHHTMFAREGGPFEGLQFLLAGFPIPIRRVEFQGASHLDNASLQAAIQLLLGTNYERHFVRDFIAANVSPLYWQRGYLRVAFAEPTVEIIKSSAPEVAVATTIPVREGLQYRLAEIHWTGNTVFSPSDLAKSVHVAPGEPANSVQLQEDLEALENLYGTRGYIRAKIEPKPAFQDDPPKVSYELRVGEGDQYKMGAVKITGIDPGQTSSLLKRWKLGAGSSYDKSYMKVFISQIGRHLPPNPKGWKIGSEESIDDNAKTVNVTISLLSKDAP